jgi:non-ribosomal peptide synthetase component E (peptide arylation enzyme)
VGAVNHGAAPRPTDYSALWHAPAWDLAALVRARALELGETPYLSFAIDGGSLTFAEADRRSDDIVAGLHALGVSRGDHLLILMGNRAEFVSRGSQRRNSVWRRSRLIPRIAGTGSPTS